MGCEKYYILAPNEKEEMLFFSEFDNDDWVCLCTFPGNNLIDPEGERLEPDDLRSLALLGAAVVIASRGDLPHGRIVDSVPEWIREEICAKIPLTNRS